MLSKTSKDGMHIRATYEDIQDYLNNKQQRLKYPDRTATRIRNSHEMSNLLDGEGMGFIDLEKKQLKMMLAQEEQNIIRRESMASDTPVTNTKALNKKKETVTSDKPTISYNLLESDAQYEEDKRKAQKEQNKNNMQLAVVDTMSPPSVSTEIARINSRNTGSSSGDPLPLTGGSGDINTKKRGRKSNDQKMMELENEQQKRSIDVVGETGDTGSSKPKGKASKKKKNEENEPSPVNINAPLTGGQSKQIQQALMDPANRDITFEEIEKNLKKAFDMGVINKSSIVYTQMIDLIHDYYRIKSSKSKADKKQLKGIIELLNQGYRNVYSNYASK